MTKTDLLAIISNRLFFDKKNLINYFKNLIDYNLNLLSLIFLFYISFINFLSVKKIKQKINFI